KRARLGKLADAPQRQEWNSHHRRIHQSFAPWGALCTRRFEGAQEDCPRLQRTRSEEHHCTRLFANLPSRGIAVANAINLALARPKCEHLTSCDVAKSAVGLALFQRAQ